MDIEEIIKRNKLKRHNYQTKEELPPKYKYLKNLISRTLITIIIVLGSIIFTNINSHNKEIFKSYVLEDSLEFTSIKKVYQNLFGNVDLIKTKETTTPVFNNVTYTNIETYKNSSKLTVGLNEPVSVITSGIVVFIGEKDDLGNTVIVQGNDGVDIWYSNITDTDIKVYDYVESSSILGTSNSDFIYLTITKDDKYLTYDEYQKLI